MGTAQESRPGRNTPGAADKSETSGMREGAEKGVARRTGDPLPSPLPSWNDTATRRALVGFVETVSRPGDGYVPPEERVAVFDNDGTLWCEKPMPIELGFILERLAAMVGDDPSLRERQPWKAAVEHDEAWLGGAIDKHYAGDDRAVKTLIGGVLQAFAGWPVEKYTAAATAFVGQGRHRKLARSFLQCGYRPMVELLQYLRANGFATYIVSGGNRDFMRTFAQEIYEIPPERVIGSSNELRYQGGEHNSVVYQAAPDVFDDGPAKPVRIWSRIGRRPILACGNSNGDIPMLDFAGGASRAPLRLLVRHDDDKREFDYMTGADTALARAKTQDWKVISMKNDWSCVFDAQQ
jgi:phosphoserine phosphatase